MKKHRSKIILFSPFPEGCKLIFFSSGCWQTGVKKEDQNFNTIIKIIGFVFIMVLYFQASIAQNKLTTTSKAQLSSWATFNFDKKITSQFGSRLIPAINFDKTFESKLKIDAEISLNTTGYLTFTDWEKTDQGESFKAYRLWARISGKKWELRAGLQKINFGSAIILRPLMWFDQMDPRDPLQLTNGVYGLLGRYFFKNNANLWLWTLYGNENLKGWELIGSEIHDPEYGGRFQFPVLKGELATSYHFRKANSTQTMIDWGHNTHMVMPEHRFGIDGKWDMKIGLWIESTYTHNKSVFGLPDAVNLVKNRVYNTIGIDYTFGIGNGIHVSGEQLFMTFAGPGFNPTETISFSSLVLNYPLSLLDQISVVLFYNWDNKDWYRFINFQRNYDNWSFYLMAFWNPEQFQLFNINDDNNLMIGKGLQLMAVYNF